MGTIELGLSYWLPRTVFEVEITKRDRVALRDGASFLDQVVDVRLERDTVEDPRSRMTLEVNAGLLEKISLAINLDDRGFIESINGESGRDLSPVVHLIGKAVSLAAGVMLLRTQQVPQEVPSLDDLWAQRFPKLHELAVAFDDRIKGLLEDIGQRETDPAAVAQSGAALDVLQGQLAAIGQAKRTWISAQATALDSNQWKLQPSDLVTVNAPSLPEDLDAKGISEPLAEMASRFGVLIAIADAHREGKERTEGEALTDQIALRRSRPVTVGAYVRAQPEGPWKLDPDSVVSMDVVDGFSHTDYLPLDGSWLRSRKFELSYYPDMSLKSFGLTTESSASAVATSVGEVFDAASKAAKDYRERPSELESKVESAKTQLELLKTATDMEVLAATKGRAAELAVLEQEKKIHEARG